MAGFIYYFPGVNGVSDDVLKKHGVERVFDGSSVDRVPVLQRGPDGDAGVLAVMKPDHEQGVKAGLQYKPHRQTWQEAPQGGYWIGYETDARPRPIDLQRKTMLSGHIVVLNDGESWLVPIARSFPIGMSLPVTLRVGKDGELIVGEVVKQYVAFGDLAEAHWESSVELAMQAQSSTEDVVQGRSFDDIWPLAVEALSINYRIGSAEMSVLDCLTTENLSEVTDAVVDMPTIKASMDAKKNELPENSSESDGQAA